MDSLELEQHLLVDWTVHVPVAALTKRLHAVGLDVRAVHDCAPLSTTTRAETMAAFYRLPTSHWSVHDVRASVPFRMYLLTDARPSYVMRKTTKGTRLVNQRVFDVKTELRRAGGAEHPFHATDNIQETKDNLRALGRFDTLYVPRRFRSVADVFRTLNRVPSLQWLVMRNFEALPAFANYDGHMDVDLLVNDFYATKAALDADAACDAHRIEEGGHRVLQHVMVAGAPMLFDFRHVGDQYYCTAFQREMLRTRLPYQMFCVPNREFHLHSLLYHALVHKREISPTYVEVFSRYGIPSDRATLQRFLTAFMVRRGYTYVRPEPSVGFFVTRP